MSNRLAHETSPYLLQHKDNPVDWYPWGDEALERARAENKPIFLSIGYSACHWCHVMAHESFEDEATAKLLNERFVSIKVDREERPDIDSIYMSAVQAITGSGGWPMSVFLMPDCRPFYGGTYFPKTARGGMPAFSQVLNRIAQLFEDNRDGLAKDAGNLTQAISHSISLLDTPSDLPGDEILQQAFQGIANSYDSEYGGFSSQPKFPPAMALELLLRLNARLGWQHGLKMATHTLDRMAAGGIYDRLGGGFHRYSTDHLWLIPHFEKMLYDNALLIRAYLNGYLVTGNEYYRTIVEQTIAYVEREMTDTGGGFYSSQDADSGGGEGTYFAWSGDELRRELDGKLDVDAVLDYWGVSARANFEGKNILWVPDGLEKVAARHNLSVVILKSQVELASTILLEVRQHRVKPATDTKILAAWNGLMIASLAYAGRSLDQPRYVELASTAAEFILTHMRTEGRLRRSFREGMAKQDGYLEDYACIADALIELYQSTFDTHWFEEAFTVCEQMVTLFWDENGGFFDTPRGQADLIVRPQELTDNAIPSGTSMAVAALLRMAILTGRDDWREKAERILSRLAPAIAQYPSAFSFLACQLDFRLSNPHEIVLSGSLRSEDTQQLLKVIWHHYLPHSIVALAAPEDDHAARMPILKDRPMKDGKATAYVCHDYVCRLPVTSPEALTAELGLSQD